MFKADKDDGFKKDVPKVRVLEVSRFYSRLQVTLRPWRWSVTTVLEKDSEVLKDFPGELWENQERFRLFQGRLERFQENLFVCFRGG